MDRLKANEREATLLLLKDFAKIPPKTQLIKPKPIIRKLNNETPIILMGYYNSIFNLGIDKYNEGEKRRFTKNNKRCQTVK